MGTMTGETTDNDLRELFNDSSKIKADLKKIKAYVKDELFQRTIFVFDEKWLAPGGWLHNDFMENCHSLVGRDGATEMTGLASGSTEKVYDPYMTLLWTVLTKDKCCKTWLAGKRSNTCQAMMDKFHSK